MKPVGKVDLRFERRVRILRTIRDDDVTENESTTDGEPLTDPPEKLSLALRRQVVNGQGADNKVKFAFRQRILQTADSEVSSGKHLRRHGYHLGAGIETDQPGRGMPSEDPKRRLSRPHAELQDPSRHDGHGRLGDHVLELVVGRHLRANRVQVRTGVEVELTAAHHPMMPNELRHRKAHFCRWSSRRRAPLLSEPVSGIADHLSPVGIGRPVGIASPAAIRTARIVITWPTVWDEPAPTRIGVVRDETPGGIDVGRGGVELLTLPGGEASWSSSWTT